MLTYTAETLTSMWMAGERQRVKDIILSKRPIEAVGLALSIATRLQAYFADYPEVRKDFFNTFGGRND